MSTLSTPLLEAQPTTLHDTPPRRLALAEVPAVVERLAESLADTAVARDQAGGHAAAERALIRHSGLLALSIPTAHGGLGADWATVYGAVRRLAEVDSALAHVFAFHHLQMASVLLYGNADQHDRFFGATLAENLFWGNALNPLDTALLATPTDTGWRLDGQKSFASGSVGSDRLCLSAHLLAAGANGPRAMLVGVVATRHPGIEVHEDWDAFGQRQTDSGTVRFSGVPLPRRDVLLLPGAPQTPRATLRPQIAQLILAHLYLGLARGAFDNARRFTLDHTKPWFASGVARAADDPVVQHRYGQLRLWLLPAELALERAVAQLQDALDAGPALSAAQRGGLAVSVAEGKVLAHRAAMEISQQLFELTGARSTSARHGLDRFWRNARVHTLHDPVDYKLRDIGRHVLDGAWPTPTPYA